MYLETLKNVSFCAVHPPFSPGSLRAQFQKDLVDSHVDATQVSRYSIFLSKSSNSMFILICIRI